MFRPNQYAIYVMRWQVTMQNCLRARSQTVLTGSTVIKAVSPETIMSMQTNHLCVT